MEPESDPAMWRARLFAAADEALAQGQRIWNDKRMGQGGLFSSAAAGAAEARVALPKAKRWTTAELSSREKASVGFYLSSHPLDAYEATLNELNILHWRTKVRFQSAPKLPSPESSRHRRCGIARKETGFVFSDLRINQAARNAFCGPRHLISILHSSKTTNY